MAVQDVPVRAVGGRVAAARQGRSTEDDLLRALHQAHGAALWSYVLRLVGGDRGRAEDVVQETLVRAWRHPEVLDGSRGSARGWLCTVARRIVIDEWRWASARPEVVTAEVPELDVPGFAERSADTAVVVAALKRISPEHREVLVEGYYRGASVAEASARLGIPPGTVKSRTHYALRALRLALEEIGALP